MSRIILLTMLLLFSSQVLTAQTGTLAGTIKCNDQPVEFVNVSISGTGTGAVSDRNGNFTISNIPAGKYLVVASMIGYESFRDSVLIESGQKTILPITLTEEAGSLEEVVITGTMKEVSKSESPVAVEVYTPQFFKKNPTPALFESLQNINGVRPQINCSVCNTGDIHINGMEGPYTMVMIDGMPIVSGLATVYGLNGIPNSLVERIEIVKGPASALYGSEAVGGLINVITKSPLSAPLLSIDIFATDWQEMNFDFGMKTKLKKAFSLLGINYFNYTNPLDKNGDGFTDLTLQNRLSIFNKWDFKRKENRLATIAVRYVYEDRWGGQMNWTPEFRGTDSIYGESIYTSRIELLGNYQLPVSNEDLLFQYSFSYHDQNSYYGTTAYMASQQIAFAQLRWNKKIARHDLLTGMALRTTWYDDNTPATGIENTGVIINNPSLTYLPGIFLQDEIAISEHHKMLLGLRADYHSAHKEVLTPRINYKWSPDKENILRIGAGNGFRVVNIFTEDHAALTGSRNVVINEDLHPERSWNTNVNYVRNFFMKNAFINIDISGFYTYFTNKIIADYHVSDELIIYDNLDGFAVSRGITLNTEWNFRGKLKINAGATLMEVYQVENDIRQRQLLTENFSGTFSVSYKFPRLRMSFDYTGNVYGPMKLPLLENDFRPEYSPLYSIQNIQLTKSAGKYWEFYAGVKNLLNFRPSDKSIMRAFDPFDKQADDIKNNPFGYTFDASYVYSSFQGIRAFAGLRLNLKG